MKHVKLRKASDQRLLEFERVQDQMQKAGPTFARAMSTANELLKFIGAVSTETKALCSHQQQLLARVRQCEHEFSSYR